MVLIYGNRDALKLIFFRPVCHGMLSKMHSLAKSVIAVFHKLMIIKWMYSS